MTRRLFGTLCGLVFLVNLGRTAFAPLLEPLRGAFGATSATLGLVATVIFAVPVGVFGVETALAGRPMLGVGLIVVAALMVLLPQRLTTPTDLPAAVVERVVGDAVTEPDDDEE